jgi:hypothetical protein
MAGNGPLVLLSQHPHLMSTTPSIGPTMEASYWMWQHSVHNDVTVSHDQQQLHIRSGSSHGGHTHPSTLSIRSNCTFFVQVKRGVALIGIARRPNPRTYLSNHQPALSTYLAASNNKFPKLHMPGVVQCSIEFDSDSNLVRLTAKSQRTERVQSVSTRFDPSDTDPWVVCVGLAHNSTIKIVNVVHPTWLPHDHWHWVLGWPEFGMVVKTLMLLREVGAHGLVMMPPELMFIVIEMIWVHWWTVESSTGKPSADIERADIDGKPLPAPLRRTPTPRTTTTPTARTTTTPTARPIGDAKDKRCILQ